MYAIIASGGKQYRVKLGDQLSVEKLDAEPGTTIEFDKVLLVADGEKTQIGTPFLTETVVGEVLAHGKHKKVEIVKFKRRKHHMKHQGHRQEYTKIKITKIGKEELKAKAAPKPKEEKPEPTAESEEKK